MTAQQKVNLPVKIRGRFKLTRRDATTLAVREETPWFDNLILDQGLNAWATLSDVLLHAKVGTSSTPPAYDQTTMLGYVASSGFRGLVSSGARSTAPYYGFNINTYRFDAGVAAGTLAEVGIGWSTGNDTDTLWCRALILDADGDPTTITVLSDEVLDVTYELRLYPDLTDHVFTIDISGESYDCIIRASAVTASDWGNYIYHWATYTVIMAAYNGTLGPITTGPSGISSNPSSYTELAYVDGSLQRGVTATWGLDNGNLAGGISAIQVITSAGMYKMSLSPPIPKTNVQTLTLNFMYDWSRYIP